jgi:hypothetical protein
VSPGVGGDGRLPKSVKLLGYSMASPERVLLRIFRDDDSELGGAGMFNIVLLEANSLSAVAGMDFLRRQRTVLERSFTEILVCAPTSHRNCRFGNEGLA